ncbi:hypothetical protein DL765_010165 [Monosporascus sp. GIB2]|nr:hypothetical protein DL765_010165 [Monosporascus sp. GIB2]
MTSQQPQNLTGRILLSTLRRLDCGVCQLIARAYEKLAAWERPEYRNGRCLRERDISIIASRDHFEVVTHFYYWYSALSTINGIRLSSAALAHNAAYGLFTQRDQGVLHMAGETSSGLPFSVTAWTEFTHPNLGGHDTDWERWPLLQRAWVLQERLLAPRVVHFASEELFWECREQETCECGSLRGLGKNSHNQTPERGSDDGIISQWHSTVEKFTLLQISVDSDKLPALSGLAKHSARLRPDSTYLAGLWSNSLWRDLLWLNSDAVSQELEARKNHPAAWRAPSWSWAAIDSQVVFPRGNLEQQYFTIDDAQSRPATSDNTGRVEGGSITITGKLFPATLSVDTSSPDPDWTLSIDNTDYVFRDGLEYDRRNVLYLDYPFNPFSLDEKRAPPCQKLYCIRMARMHAKYYAWMHSMKDLYQLEEINTEDETDGVDEAENRRAEIVDGDDRRRYGGLVASVFNLGRWLSEKSGDLERFYIPFGTWYKTCSGKRVGKIELSKIIPTIIRDYDIRQVDPRQE